MSISALARATFLFVGVCSAVVAADKPAFACNLKAISSTDRPRYNELTKRIHVAIQSRKEIAAGYTYRLNGSAVTLAEVGEWIAMERLCCPFLTLQITAAGRHSDWSLTLSGPSGVKSLLQAEFPVK